ncbi:MAG TPA: hypothetical protein DCZ95_11690 [Verrucomicrobia bacterium]|nr:MAG: hypothetical protein A2X46_01735 [Lentisphaerae bacterium GWF2_57_35]HBA84747.1 hypothetical protein [Verrucomicrobiota bacterium]
MNTSRHFIRRAVLAFIPILMGFWPAACVHRSGPEPLQGEELYRFNWWNYYARGVARMGRGQYGPAREDFENCLGVRSDARSISRRDIWLERTYGVHLIENYFPNRELGICFYQSGDDSNAVRCLEKSLQDEPSGRAKHYLNLARRRRLDPAVATAPSIEFRGDPAARWTRAREEQIRGTAQGPGYIAEILVNGRSQFVELADERRDFSELVPLREGSNVIHVAARDLLGREAQAEQIFMADWQPPQIVVTRSEKKGGRIVLEGVCYDQQALGSVSANGRSLLKAAPGQLTREVPFALNLEAHEILLIQAWDLAGNPLEWSMNSSDLLAYDGAPVAVLASTDDSIPAVSSPSDQAKPVLRLFEQQPAATIYGNEYYLDGEALDGGGLASIHVNGEEWMKPEHRGAQRRRFAGFLQVDGTNIFTVSVRDLAGNVAERQVAVISRVPEYLDEHYRLRVAALPWRGEAASGWISRDEAGEYLSEIVARPPVRFRLLARGDEWTDILHELELSASELADPRTAVKIGRLLPADLLLTGSIFEDGEGTTFYIKVVDTAEGTVLYAGDVYTEKKLNDWRVKIEGLVSKMEQGFPLIESRIEELKSNTAIIAAGGDSGVRVGAKFIVVESGAAVLGGEDRFVELVVSKVDRERCVARIATKTGAELVKTGARVYSR